MIEISNKNKPLEIYVHIPFCVKKCNYCDFLSMPCDEETKDAYMEALCTEIAGKASRYADFEVVSIFIGGGTPSTVKPMHIKRLMGVIHENYKICKEAEITIEVNPGTVNQEALMTYREAGINRLSIGLQTANEAERLRLGRIHSYDDFLKAYFSAREVGFSNINVDVMSAIPGQTLESYLETLKKLVSLDPAPEHISAYSLIVEEGTPFYEEEENGTLDVPDEDTERRMYEMTKEVLLRYGYHRYEISNYAKDGYECRHNKGYWERTDYVGFGIGSASLIGTLRFANREELDDYIETPLSREVVESKLTKEEEMSEFMFLGLRLSEGILVERFEVLFSCKLSDVFGPVIKKHIGQELLEETEGRIRLTNKGMDVANYVMADFLLGE